MKTPVEIVGPENVAKLEACGYVIVYPDQMPTKAMDDAALSARMNTGNIVWKTLKVAGLDANVFWAMWPAALRAAPRWTKG